MNMDHSDFPLPAGGIPGRLDASFWPLDGIPAAASAKPLYITRYAGPRARAPLESHPFWELTYGMGGQGCIELPDREFALPEATLLLLPPGCPHRERAEHPHWDTLWLGFQGDLPERLGLTAPTILENGHALRPWCEQIWLWRQRETGSTGPELENLTEFLVRACARLVQNTAGSSRKPWLASVQDYIENHLQRDLSVEELAAVAGYSMGHFHREFHRATGETPVQCLTRRRLETARLYLRQSGLPIREIAATVGFADPLYFSRVFRRHFGCSPSQVAQASGPGG